MKTKETKWLHLPNAHHIDWVLASLKKTPELWVAARDASWAAAWAAARNEAWVAARSAARSAAWAAARNEAGDAVLGVVAALVAYDDCDDFLNMSYEKLKIWAILSEDRRAILLLPMVYVREKLKSVLKM